MTFLSQISVPSWLSSFPRNPLVNNPFNQHSITRNIFFVIGAAYVLSKTLYLTKALISSLQLPYDLVTRYGKNTWALITGSSDGAGKAFALELARRGFNIVLVARNKEKLEAVEKEIQSINPGIQTRVVVADFSKAYEEGFAEKIYEQVQDLDISILINNVGVGGFNFYGRFSLEKIRETVSVNCLSHALIMRVFLPKLAARTQRSAIINVTSIAAFHPFPGFQLYAASKVFHSFLSRGVAYEYPNMDILSLKPAGISTKMSNFRKPDFQTILPQEFALASLNALGKTNETPGHWKHKRLYWIVNSMPEFLFVRRERKRVEAKIEQLTKESKS